MTRTTKDVYLKGVSLEEAKAVIVKWAKENKVKILINTPIAAGAGAFLAPQNISR